MTIELTVNGRRHSFEVPGEETLLTTLRQRLGLTGTKEGCAEGECGACTVLLDGVPVDSCIYPTCAVGSREVTTIEGIGDPSALQAAMVRAGAVQCGFCTPGFVMTLTALLAENPAPAEEEIRHALAGNLCRCTGYAQIVDAVVATLGGRR
jgi:carbon-monoxide dehydrogenase small subunit